MDFNSFFKKVCGYDFNVFDNWKSYINLWKSWYQGKTNYFHIYTVYNGMKYVKRERMSLQTAKFISEKMADLLFNEKVKITLGDEKSTKILNDILTENNFQLMMNRGIEKSFAFGTGCVLVDLENIYLDGTNNIDFKDSKVKLSFVPAENIYPISWNENKIKELAIVEFEKRACGKQSCIIKVHRLNERQKYEISSYKCDISSDGNFCESLDEIYVKKFETNSTNPWFSILMPNISNNIDINSPFGVSIFANSIDLMKGIDLIYDSLVNEIQLGRKRLFTTKEVLRFNTTTGAQELNFDPNDIVFYAVGDGFQMGDSPKNYIQEINGQLRIDEHVKSLDSIFRILGSNTGFGSNYFTFSENTLAPKTATEVISENSDLFRTIKKHEQVLESAVRNIVNVIHDIGELTGNYHIDVSKLNIDFDDSIIESKDQERNEDRQDLAQDTLSRIEYVMKWRGLDRESATKKIEEIDSEKSAKEGITFIEGEIN